MDYSLFGSSKSVPNLILLFVLVVMQVLGNVGISYGIKQVGEIVTINPGVLIQIGSAILSNGWVLLGILLQIISLLLYLTAISRMDLSYVLPIMSFSYVLTTLFAWLILGEHISPVRWVGTLLVTIGVSIVSLGDRQGSRQQSSARSQLRQKQQPVARSGLGRR